nr:TPA_asm: PA protein [Pecan associated jivivirus 1]
MSSASASDVHTHPAAVTGEQVLEFGKLFGIDNALKLVAYGEKCLALEHRRVSLCSASVRSASSTGSSSIGSPLRAGLTGTRLESIAKVDSWRSGGDNIRRRVPSGLCYSKLLMASMAPSVVEKAGEWPTFGSLVRLSAKSFQSVEDLRRFRLVPSGDGVCHVKAGGKDGFGFLEGVATYASRISAQPGTLAFAVAELYKQSEFVPVAIDGRTRVGGVDGELMQLGSPVRDMFDQLSSSSFLRDDIVVRQVNAVTSFQAEVLSGISLISLSSDNSFTLRRVVRVSKDAVGVLRLPPGVFLESANVKFYSSTRFITLFVNDGFSFSLSSAFAAKVPVGFVAKERASSLTGAVPRVKSNFLVVSRFDDSYSLGDVSVSPAVSRSFTDSVASGFSSFKSFDLTVRSKPVFRSAVDRYVSGAPFDVGAFRSPSGSWVGPTVCGFATLGSSASIALLATSPWSCVSDSIVSWVETVGRGLVS